MFGGEQGIVLKMWGNLGRVELAADLIKKGLRRWAADF